MAGNKTEVEIKIVDLPEVKAFLASINGWRSTLTERQLKEVEHAQDYMARFNHGTTGHRQFEIIDILAKLLDGYKAAIEK